MYSSTKTSAFENAEDFESSNLSMPFAAVCGSRLECLPFAQLRSW